MMGKLTAMNKNPVFWVYDEPGIYSVSLTVSDEVARDNSTELKLDYITVLEYPVHNITQDICYETIQEGIDDSNNGDIVLVESGIYVENINFNGKAVILGSLFYTTQDTSYISQTIIDGNQNGSVVTFESGEDSTSVLTGFTITNGQGVGYPDFTGGGITCINYSCPSLENVTITNNSTVRLGGGIYCFNYSSPNLENVTITDNSTVYGGGIYCYYSSPSLENVTITGNSAGEDGGGIYCYNNSNPSLTNVTIADNSAENYGGGGIYCDSSNPILTNVTIEANSAEYYGGGIYCYSNSNPTLNNVTITGNSAAIYRGGGGIYCYDNSNPILINSIMWNDTPQEVCFEEYFNPKHNNNSLF